MKKTILKKTITMLLLLAALMSLTLPISAAYTWTADGYQYTGSVTVLSSNNYNYKTNDNALHSYGTDTVITASSSRTFTQNAASALGSGYNNKVRLVLSDAGYADTVYYRVVEGTSVTVPATAMSDFYCLGVRFLGASIKVLVKKYDFDSDGNIYLVSTDSSLHSDFTPRVGAAYRTYMRAG